MTLENDRSIWSRILLGEVWMRSRDGARGLFLIAPDYGASHWDEILPLARSPSPTWKRVLVCAAFRFVTNFSESEVILARWPVNRRDRDAGKSSAKLCSDDVGSIACALQRGWVRTAFSPAPPLRATDSSRSPLPIVDLERGARRSRHNGPFSKVDRRRAACRGHGWTRGSLWIGRQARSIGRQRFIE